MTVGTNALLEERGARTALIATEGFTDLLEIGRQNRPQPLPPLRAEARAAGRRRAALRRPASASARRASIEPLARRARSSGCVAGVRATGRRVGRDLPALLLPRPGPRGGDRRAPARGAARRPRLRIARGAAAVPRVRALLDDRDRRLPLARCSAATSARLAERAGERGLPEPLVMQSSGGVAPAAEAARAGAWSVLSGPAGGRGRRRPAGPALRRRRTRSGSTWAAPRATSAWSRTARCGAPTRARSRAGSCSCRWSTSTPSAPAAARSAGATRGGALRVGPRSAGAEPGPACYGRGGSEPTVTDANLAARLPGARTRPWPAASRSTPRRRARAVARARRRSSGLDELDDGRGDRPGRQPGDGPGAAGGHGRARRRPARASR